MRWRCRPGCRKARAPTGDGSGGIDDRPAARRAVSPDRAAPAQPRHLCRAVLRPRLRLRGHADLAHAACALHAAGRACRSRCCSSRCGGCGSTPPGSPTGSIPKRPRSGCCCLRMTLGGLVLSTSIPTAFEGRGLWFAMAYAAMQVGKTVFLWVSTAPAQSLARANAIRITAWLSLSAVFWIAGGLAEGQIAAAALGHRARRSNMSRRRCGSGSPDTARPPSQDWVIEGGHMAERCAGFIIIALGESIVVTGATFAELTWTPENVAAFVSAFVGSSGDVVDLFPHRRRSRFRAAFKVRASRDGWRGSPIPICTCRSWPASSLRRWRMNWC